MGSVKMPTFEKWKPEAVLANPTILDEINDLKLDLSWLPPGAIGTLHINSAIIANDAIEKAMGADHGEK